MQWRSIVYTRWVRCSASKVGTRGCKVYLLFDLVTVDRSCVIEKISYTYGNASMLKFYLNIINTLKYKILKYKIYREKRYFTH